MYLLIIIMWKYNNDGYSDCLIQYILLILLFW